MMENESAVLPTKPAALHTKPTGIKLFFFKLKLQYALVLMSVPFLIWVFMFRYAPLWGWTMAFQHYSPKYGFRFWEQKWAGLYHFRILFEDDRFLRVLRNTLVMAGINLVLGFVTAITLALLLNELRQLVFKRVVQTISYLPYFLSWVVAASIVQNILSPDGVLNMLLLKLGIIKDSILFLGVGEYFWAIFGATMVWKEIGWNTIVYLAAMTMIDPALYEAAEIDGANRFKRMWHVTLPGIKPVITVLLIMNIGYLIDLSGFDLPYLLGNGLNIDYSENIEIFTLKWGVAQGNYSLATAAGIFKTIVSFILLFAANNVAKRLGEARLY